MVFLSSTIVAGSFVLEVRRVLDPALKINVETIHLFKSTFKFVSESYLLLNYVKSFTNLVSSTSRVISLQYLLNYDVTSEICPGRFRLVL